jgi:hypothetical protein
MPLDNYRTLPANDSTGIAVQIAGAYTANDVVGGLLTFTLGGAIGGGILNSILLVDDDSEGAALDLYLFNAAPTTIADDAAFAPVVADLKKLITKISIVAGDYVTVNGNDFALKETMNHIFSAVNGLIYGYLVCTGTPTYTAATDLYLELRVLTQ